MDTTYRSKTEACVVSMEYVIAKLYDAIHPDLREHLELVRDHLYALDREECRREQ